MFLLHNSIDNYKFTHYTTKKYLASSLTNTGKVFGGKRVKQTPETVSAKRQFTQIIAQ